nr:hypothetical protein [Tanacetum cinerariifolium]
MPIHIIVKDMRTIDMTIDQQVALDEALVPHASRLRTFDELLFEEEILAFLRFLGHSREIRKLTDVNINKLHQPWRLFEAVINKCLSGKSTSYDSLRLSQAQILWGMYHKKNVDFAYLLWEDFVYQVEHKDAKKSNDMYYPRNSEAYKEYYAVASGAAPPKTKASVMKTKSSSDTTITPSTTVGTRLSTLAKGKQRAKASKAKGLTVLLEVAMTEAKQMKLATKRSMQQTHISQASGSGVDEGTGIIPGVPDVPTDESDEEISWKSSDEDDDDEVDERSEDQDDDDDQGDDDQDDNDDDQDTDNDGDDFVHPELSIHEKEAKDKESFDPIIQTPKNSDDEGNDDASLGLNVGGEEGQDAEDDDEELYRDVNINLEGRDVQMTNAHTTQEFKDAHVTLTLVNPDGQQQSSSMSSQFVTSMLNPSPDAGIDSLFETTLWFAEAVSSIPGIVERYMDQRMNEAVKVKEQVFKILPKIEQTVNEKLKAEVLTRSSNSSKTSYAMATDLSEMVLKKILIEKMESNKSIHRSDEQRNLYKDLVDAYESDKIILDTYKDTITLKRCHDDADKDEEPSAGLNWGSKRRREGKEPASTSAPKEKETMTNGKSCKSLLEHKFFLEEVYKATTDQLDWNNPEGQRYPHNLLKPLPLIPNSRGCRVIPFDHFINNDLEYLRGGASSQLQIVEWHDYKHLDWITMRRDDDKLYKFKEGEFKRLRIQDIEDMLLLLNKDKQNRLVRIDELHKFSDGTLNDVQTTLDDHLKGIRMKYLPQTIWRKSDKERTTIMIQAIDKQLKTRRIMRSLEKFVGGRLYEGDFRMLQRTI